MAKSYLTPFEFTGKKVIKFPLFYGIFLIVGLLFSKSASSQTFVDTWTTISIPNTLDTRLATGGETLNFGAGPSTSVMNITVGGTVFQPVPNKLSYTIRRVDNVNTNDGVVGDAINLDDFDPWFKEVNTGFIELNNNYSSPFLSTINEVLGSNIIDIGLDNTFNNDPTLQTSNIERIDVVFDNPVTLTLSDLSSGFPIFERGNSGNVAVAAILAVDGSGNPTQYSSVVVNSGYGPALLTNYRYDLLTKLESDSDYQFFNDGNLQNINGIFFSWADFGLAAGTTIYGYSVGAADSPTTPAGFLDYTTFPTNSDQGVNQGGADLIFNFQYFAVVGDTDGDGLTDDVDLDDDGDGILDTEETNVDLDGDSFPNHLDLDSDGDGIPDNIEAQSTVGYVPPNGLVDANGVDTAYTGGLLPIDIDGDSSPDYLDLDSDNDGANDTTEAGLILAGDEGTNGLDSNVENTDDYSDLNGSFDNTQFNNFPDSDNDVFYGGEVDYRDNSTALDSDGDGVPDIGDQDDDNDGILDILEGLIDTDGDGIPNNLDLDSDNDGIADVVEAGFPDIDNNGLIDGFTDLDNDGVDDSTNPDLFPQDNAASAISEVNGIGSLGQVGVTATSQSLEVLNGSYALYVVSNSTAFDRLTIDIPVVTGETFNISAWARRGSQGTDQKFFNWQGFDNGQNTSISSTVWTQYTFTVTATITGIAQVRAYAVNNAGSGLTGDDFYIDNISIRKSIPLQDTDTDGIPDFLDLDSDNDGIPDNIEGQVTLGYISPDGIYDLSGFDTAYIGGFTPIDTDGDSIPDYLDLNSDDEGADDTIEAGLILSGNVGSNGLDANSETSDDYVDVNGIFNNPSTDFPDSDNDINFGGDVDYRDNFADPDSDGDTIPDIGDLDDDNDGILDVVETGGQDPSIDSDGDHIPFYLDDDDSNSLIGDDNGIIEPGFDLDGDGIANHLDIDSDNDNVYDIHEAGHGSLDSDGNGMIDGVPADFGLNGLLNTIEDNDTSSATTTYIPLDTDSDTILDFLDVDDDGDGVNTIFENDNSDADGDPATGISLDTDSDGTLDYLDVDDDGDGVNTIFENDNTDADGDPTTGVTLDTDSDGTVDYLDVDDDGDGVNTIFENDNTDGDGDPTTGIVMDTDSDSILDYLDTDDDGDGILTSNEGPNADLDGNPNTGSTQNTDGDNVFDYLDIDDDNDGILTLDEDANGDLDPSNDDSDNDGVLNYLDLDSDADGISDILEAGGTDVNGDGQVDYTVAGDPTSMTDTNGNGLTDALDPSNGGTALPLPNTDGTGGADYVDIDADGDGIVDNIEAQVSAMGLGGYRAPSGSDDDGDGIDNNYDINNIGNIIPIDTDSDGSPDYIDANSDDDADDDLLEGWDTNNDGIANFNPTGGDTDGDGLDNGFDLVVGPDPTNGGQTASTFPDLDTPGGEPDWREPLDIDWDNDGIDDPIDLDDDNDGITDIVESFGNDPNGDEDGDGIANWLDTSDDGSGDGSATDYTDADGNGIPDVYDFDGDGVPNHFDLDSDNDGIFDVIESGQLNGTTVVDLTMDGILDGNPSDFGANGLLNLIETDDTGAATTTQPASDSDADGIPDSLELNSDGDGCPDVTEAGFTDLDGSNRLGTETGLTVDVNGLVNTPGLTDGYTEPADGDANGIYDFQEAGQQVTIAVQPTDQTVILNANANFDVTLGNGVNPTYQWFESVDGGTSFTALSNGGIYSGAYTATLTINANTLTLDGNLYRVVISAHGYACGGDVTSDSALLTVYPDFDGDGIGDPIDLDDDNDGILDTVEGTGDFDGDGQPNHHDFDADGDGIYDIYESGRTTGVDANGDGMLDGPVGANGVPDSIETAVDSGIINYTIRNTDGDGQPNFLDRDDDGDGVNTINESPDPNGNHNPSDAVNTDGDGRPNYLDIDDDGDGILTRHEGTANPDGDGRANYLDLDSDGDGIPDNVEGQTTAGYIAPSGTDTDNDGLDNAYDATSGYVNSNGILANTVNSDAGTPWSDASPDYLDLDSDGDTVPDRIEGHDHNFDGLPDVGPSGDSDNDGLDNSYDSTTGYADPNGNVVTTNPATDLPNTDGTGDVNYRDRDDDGDSILTIYENPDPNSDGNFTDSQNSDASTGDIRPDYLDADDDGDGIPTINENPDPNGDGNPSDAQDIDEDGIPDYLDNDDDNDGIATIDEDIDGDGNPANDDNDGDGVPNYLDIDDDNDGILTITEGDNFDDYDLDGYPDYLDLDSDDDGIPDNVESQTTAAYLLPTGVDDDNDGLDNAYDSNDGGYPNSVGITPNNNDGTDNPDYLDTDSDNDSVPDSIEGHDFDANGEADVVASGSDSDGDGLDDAFDGSIGDFADPNGLAVVTNPATDLPNRDGNVPSIYAPITMDDEVDYRDADDDGDGIPTAQEDGDLDGDPTNDDCDEDGTPDYLDYTSCSIVPEAFSPNGDGVNDTLVVPALAQYPNFTMEVYDRWGNIVYEYDNNGRAQPIWWDGYSTGSRTINKGVRVPVGTYFYVIEFNQDRVLPVSGWVYINY